MFHQLTLRLSAFLFLTAAGSTASACCLLPFLNPFAWMCGHGCGYGQGYAAVQPWCGPLSGHPRYGWHQAWGATSNNPGFPATGPALNCEYPPGTVTPPMVPATTGFNWPGNMTTSQTAAWGTYGGWRPQYRWSPPATAWQIQPLQYSMMAPGYATPQSVMSTAPAYGPVETMLPYTQPTAAHVAGDIAGDHEFPVIPNSFNPAVGIPIQPAGYLPRTVRRYRSVVR